METDYGGVQADYRGGRGVEFSETMGMVCVLFHCCVIL